MLLYLPLRTVNLFMRIGYLSQLSPAVSHSLYLLLFRFIFYLFSWLWQSLPQQREEHVVCISTGLSIHWTKEDTIATLTEDDDAVSENNQHIHPPNPQQIRVSKAIDKMKERVTTEATPIPQVYRDTMNEMYINPTTSGATANVPTLPSMKSSLYRKRRERLPPKPATIYDVSFDGDWALSLTKEQFLVQSQDNIHVFATEKNLYLIAPSK